MTSKQLFAVLLVCLVGQSLLAAPPVGLVMAKRTVRIDTSPVQGNATILSGNVLESVGGTSEVRLGGGSVFMDTNARMKVFADRAELQTGKIQVRGSNLRADAGSFRIEAGEGSEAILERTSKRVVVASLRGSVRLMDPSGTLLASLAPGTALALDPDGDGTGDKDAASGASPSETTQKKNSIPVRKGMGIGTKGLIAAGVATAVAVPTAIVASRDEKTTVSR
jgi:hypothetical protein